VSDTPVTQYVRAVDGAHLAYHVSGGGALGFVVLPDPSIPIDLMWDEPGMVRIRRRLSTFSRTVWFELRGAGSSEGATIDATVSEIFDADLTAVLDAAGHERVALLASSTAGQSAIHFAVTHPERLSALVLFNTYAHYVQHHDYPWGLPPEMLEPFLAATVAAWGTTAVADVLAPSRTADERFRQWLSRCGRLGAGPDEVAAVMRASFERDYRHLLSAIEVPTLVLHQRGNPYIRVGAGRYLAEHIPGARYVELPGEDQLLFVGDVDAWVDEVEEFLTGRHQPAEGEVVLATVLFTDIVNSTAQEAAMGRRAWARLTDEHDALVRGALARHRGRAVKTMGDGFLATFDATTRAVRCAVEIVTEAEKLGLELRAGLHTGEIEVRDDDVAGLGVTIGKRICDLAGPGQVLVTETVKGLVVGSGIALSEHGTHVLKGVPETWRLFVVEVDPT
jgi:class 3 adenylate cyclase